MKLPTKCAAVAVMLMSVSALFPAQPAAPKQTVPPELDAWARAYPNEDISYRYSETDDDWIVSVGTGDTRTELRWAGGRFLPPRLVPEKEKYRVLLYRYSEKLADPADFSPQEIERVTQFGSTENRMNAPVMYPGFFDAVYDSADRQSVERNIASATFLGKRTEIHRKIEAPLKRVEERITRLAKENAEVRRFIDTLSRVDGYLWRDVRDTASRSFHSFGLAVDVLPTGWGNKILYWNWEKNKGNAKWMLIPLKDRWMPPQAVIDAFEAEGFIWGGKWGIWDNMHFEYRPELLVWQETLQQKDS